MLDRRREISAARRRDEREQRARETRRERVDAFVFIIIKPSGKKEWGEGDDITDALSESVPD